MGTIFLGQGGDGRIPSRKHWLAFAVDPRGVLVIDPGAENALVQEGRSLLPSGIREVRGSFRAGDPVRILGREAREVARGLVGYGADEIERIRGRHTSEIDGILGYRYMDEVIHRDDLVITRGKDV